MSKKEKKNPYRKVPRPELWVLLLLLERRMGELHAMVTNTPGAIGDEAARFSDDLYKLHEKIYEVLEIKVEPQ